MAPRRHTTDKSHCQTIRALAGTHKTSHDMNLFPNALNSHLWQTHDDDGWKCKIFVQSTLTQQFAMAVDHLTEATDPFPPAIPHTHTCRPRALVRAPVASIAFSYICTIPTWHRRPFNLIWYAVGYYFIPLYRVEIYLFNIPHTHIELLLVGEDESFSFLFGIHCTHGL